MVNVNLKKVKSLLEKEAVIHIIILFVFSFFALLFFTKSSPLFFLNDWVDANAFFTTGKGMACGLVPYRDLFEQKGPFLYLIHAIAYVISNKTFFGVYIFESIGLGFSLYFFYRSARYYTNSTYALWSAFLFAFFLLALPFFKLGDSAEEFSIPFIMCLIWMVFRLDNEEDKITKISYFIQGICFGCVFLIKYTLIGAWLGFYLLIFVILMFQKEFKKLLSIVIYSVCGFICTLLPWIAYFTLKGAIREFYEVYFVFNMKIYPPEGTLITRLINSISVVTGSFSDYPIFFLILFGGLLIPIFSRSFIKNVSNRYIIIAIFVCSSVAAFYGNKYFIYYYQILMPFCSIGMLGIISSLSSNIKDYNPQNKVSLTILSFAVSFFLILTVNDNYLESKLFPDNDSITLEENATDLRPAQYIFADIMNESDNPTLLNYGALDHGFYTVADILPNNRFFERQNVVYQMFPQNMDEQNQVIQNKEVQFVVFRSDFEKELEDLVETYLGSEYKYEILQENYSVVKTHNQTCQGTKFTYWLLERK